MRTGMPRGQVWRLTGGRGGLMSSSGRFGGLRPSGGRPRGDEGAERGFRPAARAASARPHIAMGTVGPHERWGGGLWGSDGWH